MACGLGSMRPWLLHLERPLDSFIASPDHQGNFQKMLWKKGVFNNLVIANASGPYSMSLCNWIFLVFNRRATSSGQRRLNRKFVNSNFLVQLVHGSPLLRILYPCDHTLDFRYMYILLYWSASAIATNGFSIAFKVVSAILRSSTKPRIRRYLYDNGSSSLYPFHQLLEEGINLSNVFSIICERAVEFHDDPEIAQWNVQMHKFYIYRFTDWFTDFLRPIEHYCLH